MTKTEIEWCTDVWNPTAGCDRVSPGCDNCYALTMAKRLKGMGQEKYRLDGDPRTSGPGFLAHEWPDALRWPLTVKKPMRVFVNSMSDLFHANISDEFIARVFAVMALAPRHTFQVLTKRHARMRSLLNSGEFWANVGREVSRLYDAGHGEHPGWSPETRDLPNVWLGVSVEDQHWADIRIPALLDTPAAVRWLSCEPLLGPVSLPQALGQWVPSLDHPAWRGNELYTRDVLHWIVAGGESGPGARPMHPDWPRSLRDQCQTAGIPFLFKQWGAWRPYQEGDLAAGRSSGQLWDGPTGDDRLASMIRAGKKAAGRELDGRTWDEYPAAAQ